MARTGSGESTANESSASQPPDPAAGGIALAADERQMESPDLNLVTVVQGQ